MFAVSVDPPAQSAEVVARNKLPFSILSDAKRQVIEAYGVLHAHGGMQHEDVALPAQFLIGRDGTVLWHRVAERIQDRPAPAVVLDAIARHLGPP